MKFSSVLVTFPNSECAKKISHAIVHNRLAACVNIFKIESIYHWNCELQEETEAAALFKIRTEDFQEFCSDLRSRHPYEIPCIIRYDIADGFSPYLDWIRESTDRRQY